MSGRAVRIDCFMAMNRYQEAMKEYESTAKLFFEELGISPSEKMIDQFKYMSERMSSTPQTIRGIKSRLREEEIEAGAFYMTLPSFRDSYRLVRRIMERNGQSVYLIALLLVDSKGAPLEDADKLSAMSGELMSAIKHCLRKGDPSPAIIRVSSLILLVGTNKENCGLIFERIERYFSREHKSWKKYLEFYITSLADADKDSAQIVFQKNGSAGSHNYFERGKEIQYPINISAPDLVNVCVDESCDGEVAGRLYHCYRKEELCFSNLVQLLRMMEKFFDEIQFPQASTKSRSFFHTPETGEKTQKTKLAAQVRHHTPRREKSHIYYRSTIPARTPPGRATCSGLKKKKNRPSPAHWTL